MTDQLYLNQQPNQCDTFQTLYHGPSKNTRRCFRNYPLNIGQTYICPTLKQSASSFDSMYQTKHPWFKDQRQNVNQSTCMHNQPNIGVSQLCPVCGPTQKKSTQLSSSSTQCPPPVQNVNQPIDYAGSNQRRQDGEQQQQQNGGGGCSCSAPFYTADGRIELPSVARVTNTVSFPQLSGIQSRQQQSLQTGAGHVNGSCGCGTIPCHCPVQTNPPQHDIRCHETYQFLTAVDELKRKRPSDCSSPSMCQQYSDTSRFNLFRQYKNCSQDSYGHTFDLSQPMIGKRPVRSFHDNTSTIPPSIYVDRMNLLGRDFGCLQPYWDRDCM